MGVIEDLKAHFSSELAAIRSLESYDGDDWWQLSPAEAEVFHLELADMPALVIAWCMYESIADILADEFGMTELCRRARAELDYITPRNSDLPAWQTFAASLGIREAKSFAWFFKNHFGMEDTWVIERPDDDVPMPRAAVPPRPKLDADIPF